MLNANFAKYSKTVQERVIECVFFIAAKGTKVLPNASALVKDEKLFNKKVTTRNLVNAKLCKIFENGLRKGNKVCFYSCPKWNQIKILPNSSVLVKDDKFS